MDPPGVDFFNTVLYGSRMVLRPYSEDRDFDFIVAMFSDPVVTTPIGIPFPDPFIEHLRQSKRSRLLDTMLGDWTVFILDNENSAEIFAGEVGIGNFEPLTQIFEIFTAIVSTHHAKAYGREATSLLMKHIFQKYNLATIRMQTLETNRSALNLCARLGFRVTGSSYFERDVGRGFLGGAGLILDCRLDEFVPFEFD